MMLCGAWRIHPSHFLQDVAPMALSPKPHAQRAGNKRFKLIQLFQNETYVTKPFFPSKLRNGLYLEARITIFASPPLLSYKVLVVTLRFVFPTAGLLPVPFVVGARQVA